MIDLRGISQIYPGPQGPVQALRGIDLRITPGEVFGIIGRSGAGKSSLVRVINLLNRPSQGQVFVDGRDMTALSEAQLRSARRDIGMVFQHFNLLSSRTVYDNVALPLRVAGRSESSYRRDVMDLLDWVGLAQKSGDLPPVLSGGEKQRAAIARAVIAKPQVLLADEPTGNVDPVLAKRLLHLFLELNRLGTTILIATHDKGLVRQAERPVLHLEQGTLSLQ